MDIVRRPSFCWKTEGDPHSIRTYHIFVMNIVNQKKVRTSCVLCRLAGVSRFFTFSNLKREGEKLQFILLLTSGLSTILGVLVIVADLLLLLILRLHLLQSVYLLKSISTLISAKSKTGPVNRRVGAEETRRQS